jgi:hypothetical protein
MSSQLEQFIRDHRDEFDTDEPGQKVWENISEDLGPGNRNKTAVTVLKVDFLRWSIAAAVILGVAAGLWFFAGSGPKVAGTNLASKNKLTSPQKTPADKQGAVIPEQPVKSESTQKDTQSTKDDLSPSTAGNPDENIVDEEMFHYAKLVEIKHKELKKIQRDEPLLYKQFAGDVNRLDSVYHSLQDQLPKNPNREQLLEAMIQNLQLQMRLLNHQLDIIKQINHSKKAEYENAYKSI